MPGWSDHLVAHLRQQPATSVAMTLAELERLVGWQLPPTAYSRVCWVHGTGGQHLKKNLDGTGWRVSGFDRDTRTIIFSRL